MGEVLRVLYDVIRTIATMLQPYMPDTMGRMLDQLAITENERSFEALKMPVEAARILPKPEGLFPRFVEEEKA